MIEENVTKVMDKNGVKLSFFTNIASGLILAFMRKLLSVELLMLIGVFLLVDYQSYIFIKNKISNRFNSAIIILLFHLIVFTGFYWSSVTWPNKLPFSGSYLRWQHTDVIKGGNARLLVERLNDSYFELAIDQADEIDAESIYINIGYIRKYSGKYFYMVVKESYEFFDYRKGGIKIKIDKSLFKKGRDVSVYLTNKPRKNQWIKISSYKHPFYRKINIKLK